MGVVDGSMNRWSDGATATQWGRPDGMGFLASDVASVLAQNPKTPPEPRPNSLSMFARCCANDRLGNYSMNECGMWKEGSRLMSFFDAQDPCPSRGRGR